MCTYLSRPNAPPWGGLSLLLLGLCVGSNLPLSCPPGTGLGQQDREDKLHWKLPPQLCAPETESLAQLCLIESSSLVPVKPVEHLQCSDGHVTPAKGTTQARQENDCGFAADVRGGLNIPDTFSQAVGLVSLGLVLNLFSTRADCSAPNRASL